MEAKRLGEAQSSDGLPALSSAEKAKADRRSVAAVAAAYAPRSGAITASSKRVQKAAMEQSVAAFLFCLK